MGRIKLLLPIIQDWVMGHADAGKRPDIMATSVTAALCEKMNQRGDKKLLITHKTPREVIVAALDAVWEERKAESALYEQPSGIDPLKRITNTRATINRR